MTKKTEPKQSKTAGGYVKQQFLTSKHFTPIEKDVLKVLLADGKLYTPDQVKSELEAFLKKEVK